MVQCCTIILSWQPTFLYHSWTDAHWCFIIALVFTHFLAIHFYAFLIPLVYLYFDFILLFVHIHMSVLIFWWRIFCFVLWMQLLEQLFMIFYDIGKVKISGSGLCWPLYICHMTMCSTPPALLSSPYLPSPPLLPSPLPSSPLIPLPLLLSSPILSSSPYLPSSHPPLPRVLQSILNELLFPP